VLKSIFCAATPSIRSKRLPGETDGVLCIGKLKPKHSRRHDADHPLGAAGVKQQTGFTSVLWPSCLAMLAVGANGTAIMAALPTMRTELFLTPAGVQWASR
jgi:hypothetical protein